MATYTRKNSPHLWFKFKVRGKTVREKEQLKSITGAKRPKEIIRWLRAEGFTFRVDVSGWPVVHPEHYAQQMGVKPGAGAAARQNPGVNLDHLRGFVEARDSKKAESAAARSAREAKLRK